MKKTLLAPALLALFLLASCGNGGGSSTPIVRPSGNSNTNPPASNPSVASSEDVVQSSEDVVQSSEDVIQSSEEIVQSSEDVVQSSEDVVQSSEEIPTAKEYVFEAEYCPCIEDMDGATYSGGTSSYGLIGKDRDHDMNASNGWYVHFMYVEGSVLEFNIVSDRDVSDVKFVARFSAEYKDITFDDVMFPIKVNGSDLEYGTISINNVPDQGGGNKEFADFLIGENLSFHKGNNLIELVVDNNELMYGTALSTAPMTDCIKLTTTATLTWPEESPENIDQF